MLQLDRKFLKYRSIYQPDHCHETTIHTQLQLKYILKISWVSFSQYFLVFCFLSYYFILRSMLLNCEYIYLPRFSEYFIIHDKNQSSPYGTRYSKNNQRWKIRIISAYITGIFLKSGECRVSRYPRIFLAMFLESS